MGLKPRTTGNELALMDMGFLPEERYYGVVDWYDPYSEGLNGQGRIKCYMETSGSAYWRALTVHEWGIAETPHHVGEQDALREHDFISFSVAIGVGGVVAVNLKVLRTDTSDEEAMDRIAHAIRLFQPDIHELADRKAEDILPKIIRPSKEKVKNEP